MDMRKYVKKPEDRIPFQDREDFSVFNIFRKKSDNKGVLNHIDSFNSMSLFNSYTKNPTENVQEIPVWDLTPQLAATALIVPLLK